MVSARELRYIICPSCGDAVEAKKSRNRAQCSHCNSHFSYLDTEIRRGRLAYDEDTRRWREVGVETPTAVSVTHRRDRSIDAH